MTSKRKTTWKCRRSQKLALPSKIVFAPHTPVPLKNYLNFFWWPLTMTATPQLMLNRKWYQASKPEMEFHMIKMMYAALPMRAPTTFSCKDDCIFTKHTLCWTYSPLRLQYDLCCTSFIIIIIIFLDVLISDTKSSLDCTLLGKTAHLNFRHYNLSSFFGKKPKNVNFVW